MSMIYLPHRRKAWRTVAVSGTPWMTNKGGGGTQRNDLTYKLGCKFTVGGSGITITDLGRWSIASFASGTHLVKIELFASPYTLIVSGTVDASTASGAFAWVAVTPTALSASTAYFITSQETNGGDKWGDTDHSPLPTVTGAATLNIGVYGNGSPPYSTATPGDCFVPVNFKYY